MVLGAVCASATIDCIDGAVRNFIGASEFKNKSTVIFVVDKHADEKKPSPKDEAVSAVVHKEYDDGFITLPAPADAKPTVVDVKEHDE